MAKIVMLIGEGFEDSEYSEPYERCQAILARLPHGDGDTVAQRMHG